MMVRLMIEVVVQERVVELFAKENVETQRRLIEDEQLRVDRHDEREMQLRDHAFRQLPHLARALDLGPGQETLRLRAIEARMHPGDIIEQLRDPDPARQNRDIGDERDFAHQFIALRPRVAPEHLQFSLVREEPEDGVERGGFAGAIRADESEDATFLDPEINSVQAQSSRRRFCGVRVLLGRAWL